MPKDHRLTDEECFEITKKHYPKSNDRTLEYCNMPIIISNTGCGLSYKETLDELIYGLTADPFYSLLDMVVLGM